MASVLRDGFFGPAAAAEARTVQMPAAFRARKAADMSRAQAWLRLCLDCEFTSGA